MYPNYYYQNPNGGIQHNRAIDSQESPIIEVVGDGQLKIKPDIATLRFGVLTESLEVQQSQDENAKKINEIISALENAGVEKNDIETLSYTVIPQYQYTDKEKIIKGYEVRHMLMVQVQNVENVGIVYDIAFENGANIAESPTFKLSNEETYQLEALKLAIQNAVSKANAIRTTLGVTLSKNPIRVVEVSTNFTPRQQGVVYELAAMSDTTTPIQVREIEINARVEVQFTFV